MGHKYKVTNICTIRAKQFGGSSFICDGLDNGCDHSITQWSVVEIDQIFVYIHPFMFSVLLNIRLARNYNVLVHITLTPLHAKIKYFKKLSPKTTYTAIA